MEDTTKRKLIARLKRAEGQLAAVRRMVDDDAYCIDVVNQVLAVQRALKKVSGLMLDPGSKMSVMARLR